MAGSCHQKRGSGFSSLHGVAATYILVVLAAGFVLAAAWSRLQGHRNPASRTWLLIGTIFGAVSLWLFSRP